MTGSYDPGLVALSIVIAVIASYAALDLASRLAAAQRSKAAPYWLAGGALAMGTGIWAMHFIGMLAFSLPIPMSYDLTLTLCSLLAAVLASGLALYAVSRDRLSTRRLALAGVAMGAGIAFMHYLGMEAMRMQPRIDYDPLYFSLSVFIAITAATTAIWIAFRLRLESMASAFWKRVLGALVMGAAISAMHYTAMAAARFAEGSVCLASPQSLDTSWMVGSIGASALLILLTTLMISGFVGMSPTIRSRLVFLVTSCVMPVSLLAVAFVFYNYHQEREDLVDHTISTARSMILALDSDLADVESGLLVLATSSELAADDFSGFYSRGKDVLRDLHANAITLSDATGLQLIDTRRPYGDSLRLYDNPLQARRIFETGRPVIADFVVGSPDSEPLITIGVPVRRDGIVIYQISASISSNRLVELLVRQNVAADWLVAIFDSSGTIVARSHEMSRFIGKKGAPRLLERLEQVNEGSLETRTVEGIPVISAFSRAPASRWTVAIGIPIASLTGDLRNSLWWLLLALATLLAGSLGLAWRIGGSISRSIHALTEPALALGTGASVSIPPLGLTEADEVGRALTRASAILALARHEAQHDVLTGLANRALFNEIVSQQLMIAKRSGGNLAVLYIDLDGFKTVNDTHGHDIGDALLKAVAARIQVMIREGDLAARLGGDEFAVVLIQPGVGGSLLVAGKLVDSLAIPFPIGSLSLEVSASIGVAHYPESATTAEALLRKADEAMYKAKQAGKQRFVVAQK